RVSGIEPGKHAFVKRSRRHSRVFTVDFLVKNASHERNRPRNSSSTQIDAAFDPRADDFKWLIGQSIAALGPYQNHAKQGGLDRTLGTPFRGLSEVIGIRTN